ncbi:hypothetical protein GW17_00015324 [Ensete ventricosum]|nr:hypothetical protein GW17_00015324 [Ensete ventricosum]
MSIDVMPPLKRLKKLGDSPTPIRKPKPAPKVLRWEGSNRKKEKWVARPRSMRDLCRVKARVPNEPYMAQEIAKLPESDEDGPLKAKWASLTPRHKVWVDGADAQLDEVQRREAKAFEKVKAMEKGLQGLQEGTSDHPRYKESADYKSGLEKMGWVSYEFDYKIALTHFQIKHLGLEVEEDPCATHPEDANVSMEMEVPFDDSDPWQCKNNIL